MHTYTALYDNRQDAEAAQARLEQLGILDADRYGITDQTTAGFDGTQGHGDGGGRPNFFERLFGMSDNDDRQLYEHHVRGGGYLLTVDVDEAEADQVREVLDASGAIDVDERERDLRQRGVLGASAATDIDRTGDTLQLAEERLNVGKRMVERGTARVRTYVVETPVQEQVTLRSEHAEIDRRPAGEMRAVSGAGADALFQERTIEVIETAEVPVVAKEAYVREEIGIRKEVDERVETVSDTIRRTEVDVDRVESDTVGLSGDMNLTDEERLRRADQSYRS